MNKKEIKVIIKNNSDISEEKYLALKDEQKIEYFEKDVKTSLILKNNIKLKRENDNYFLEMEFIPNKTTEGIYKLKNENLNISLEISTDYVIIEENFIIIKYKVISTKQDVIFKIEM